MWTKLKIEQFYDKDRYETKTPDTKLQTDPGIFGELPQSVVRRQVLKQYKSIVMKPNSIRC